jgi:hypothetical protein
MPLARFYTTAVGVFHRKVTSSESRETAILVRPTGHEGPEIARRVSDVGVRRTGEYSVQRRIVRVGVRARLAADAQKPGVESSRSPAVSSGGLKAARRSKG